MRYVNAVVEIASLPKAGLDHSQNVLHILVSVRCGWDYFRFSTSVSEHKPDYWLCQGAIILRLLSRAQSRGQLPGLRKLTVAALHRTDVYTCRSGGVCKNGQSTAEFAKASYNDACSRASTNILKRVPNFQKHHLETKSKFLYVVFKRDREACF